MTESDVIQAIADAGWTITIRLRDQCAGLDPRRFEWSASSPTAGTWFAISLPELLDFLFKELTPTPKGT